MHWLIVLLLGCGSSHSPSDPPVDPPTSSAPERTVGIDASVSVDAPALLCADGWTFDGERCAQWRPVPSPPCTGPFEPLGGFHGGVYLLCDGLAFWYDESAGAWRESPVSDGFELDDESARLPPPDNPSDPRVTASFEAHGVFVLTQHLYATPWSAELWHPITGFTDTLDPPFLFQPTVALPLDVRRILVVGPGGSMIYEREP